MGLELSPVLETANQLSEKLVLSSAGAGGRVNERLLLVDNRRVKVMVKIFEEGADV